MPALVDALENTSSIILNDPVAGFTRLVESLFQISIVRCGSTQRWCSILNLITGKARARLEDELRFLIFLQEDQTLQKSERYLRRGMTKKVQV